MTNQTTWGPDDERELAATIGRQRVSPTDDEIEEFLQSIEVSGEYAWAIEDPDADIIEAAKEALEDDELRPDK